ncbi:SLATT domain-containing protein [Chamaesiphon polymorphus]|uniref:SMODS and SLOG-associating 2TM effector domain-containing protein n=1 Tax=Chamaesiphon polymorphus CCALA 037 TaxID=2107692 RepID=A0A2T1GKE7_9CYAN|nr:SLATT domain-containing protein [Chamaesiphon polymorphus]PSB58281.1 hypothetical protein C7B77_05350 [Chamaesiphon polymorphus CCALA 037]
MSSGVIHTSDAYDKLKENTNTVMKSCFAASDRLSFHNLVSQWTLSVLSLGLIVIPLLTVTKMPLRYNQNIIDFASISLAVAILMLSLLIGANNYAARGYKMYQSGLDFNDLLRDMRYVESNSDRMTHYQIFSNRYGNILRQYENVSAIDNLQGQININRKKPISISLFGQQLKYCYLYLMELLVYIVPIVFEFSFIYFLITK